MNRIKQPLKKEQGKHLAGFSAYYRKLGIKDLDPTGITNLEEVYEKVTTDTHLASLINDVRKASPHTDAYRKAKGKLPYITPSGTFTERGARHLVGHSNLICIDIDVKPATKDKPAENHGLDIKEARERIIRDTILNPILVFTSPGGNGLKVFLSIDVSQYPFINWFKACQKYFKERHKIDIDKSCSDVSRACFLSHDPKAYFKANNEVVNLPESYLNPPKQEAQRNEQKTTKQLKTPNTNTNGYKEITDLDKVRYCVEQLESRGIDLTTHYDDWYKMAFSIGELGEPGREYFHRLSSMHSEYNYKDSDEKFLEALRSRDGRMKLDTFFWRCKEQGVFFGDLYPTKKAQPKKTPGLKSKPNPLGSILGNIEPINFQQLIYPDANRYVTIKPKEYVIYTTSEIRRIANKVNRDIARVGGKFYVYNGAYWEIIDSERFIKFLSDASQKMQPNDADAKYYKFASEVNEQMIIDAHHQKDDIDFNRVLINLSNGTFEIDGEGVRKRDFNKVDFLTYQLPFDYDPDADCPNFKRYLSQVLPDNSLQYILSEYVGYLFVRHRSKRLKEEKILMLLGSGANGKSVFFEIINAMVGEENTTYYSLKNLTSSNGYYMAGIDGKLLNYSTEFNGDIDTAIFKQLASGEPIDARLPYGKPFTVNDYAKIIVNCNELPRKVEQNNAYYRRLLIIPFDVTIPKEKQNKQLANEIIDSELPGIFNWALAGLNRLLDQKNFTQSSKSDEVLNLYKYENDSLKNFIDEKGCTKSYDKKIKLGDFYKLYKEYCIDQGFDPESRRGFGTKMKSLGYKVARGRSGMHLFIE